MQVKTLLNRVHKRKSFVYGKIQLEEKQGKLELEVEIHPRQGSLPVCSGCGKKRPGYDTGERRRFQFIPLWGISVVLLYAMRRVDCPLCQIKVERVPWAEGKTGMTKAYQWFLAHWAKRLSWQEVAEAFGSTWYHVYGSVEMAVEWGRKHINLEGITAIGVDEMQWGRGHQYVTAVYQIDVGSKRLPAASVAQYNVAVTDLYPRVTLLGSLGFQATDFTDLFSDSAFFAGTGPSIQWAAFNLGRVRAQISASDAQTSANLAAHEKTVLLALEEIDTAMTSFSQEEQRRNHLILAARSSAEAAQLASKRFEAGIDSFLDVLDAESRLLDAEDRLAQSEINTAVELTGIYQALGIGYHLDAAEVTQSPMDKDAVHE